MKMKKREQGLADQLEAYIDRPVDVGRDATSPPEAPIVEALRLSVSSVEPTPEFVERLSARLRQSWIERRTPRPSWIQQIATGISTIKTKIGDLTMKTKMGVAFAIAVIFMVAIALPRVFDGGQSPPLLPRLVHAAGPSEESALVGLLSGAELTRDADLPDAPSEAPVYVTSSSVPAMPEEALAWAQDFGFTDARLYRNPREPETIFVRTDDGRHLTFRRHGPMTDIHYGDDEAAAREGTPLSFDRAAEVAEAFLQEHNLLPDEYRVQEVENFAPSAESPFQMVEIVLLQDGRPIVGDRAPMRVSVNPAGEVNYAALNTLTFEESDVYPIKSAEEAYAELTDDDGGSPFRLDVYRRGPENASNFRYYRPKPPTYSVGDVVTVTGWVQVLVTEEGDDVWVRLTGRNGEMYDLTGPRLNELTEVGYNDVRVTGTVVAQAGARRWQLALSDWEIASPQPPQCLVGTFVRDNGEAWVEIDEDAVAPVASDLPEPGRYRLPGAPDELEDGERVEICTDAWPAVGEDVDWWHITTPPTSEQTPSGVTTISTSVVVEQAVEEVDPPQIEAPFEIGQRVEITGVVHVTIYVEGDAQRVGVNLDVREANQDLPPYPLRGPQELLEEIAEHHRLYVRVWGEIVTAGEEWQPAGQAIQVERFEKLWPEERIEGFLGHVELETLEGRQVVVFTDHETEQRYVVAQSLEMENFLTPGQDPLLDFEQIFVAGGVRPGATFAGLPLLRLTSSQHGRETEAATSADEFDTALSPHVINETERQTNELHSAFVVDRVELSYYYDPQPGYVVRSGDSPPPTPEPPTETIVQPVWVFHGRNADGSVRFTAYVQAAREELVRDE